jgi:hypothetical protein
MILTMILFMISLSISYMFTVLKKTVHAYDIIVKL